MKIAIFDIDNLHNPHWGSGQAKATYEVGTRLAQKHKVTVYCSKYPNSKDYFENNIHYKHIGLGTNNAKVNNIAFLLTLPFVTFGIKDDVIIENFTAPITTCFTPVFTHIPVIGLTSFFAGKDMAKKYALGFDKVEELGLPKYRNIIALNEHQKGRIISKNKKIDVIVIPNGVDKAYLSMPTREENYIVYLGRIDMYSKGLDLLIEAFAKIKNNTKDSLYIIGSGSTEDTNALKALIKKNALESKVKLLGKKSGKEKNTLLAHAKAIVFPSRFESHSLSSLEAIALGKPIVCFDIDGFDWIDTHAAIKIKPFDVNQFAKELEKVLQDKKIRSAIGKEARLLAKNYTWDKTAYEYETYIKKVVKKQ